MRTLLAEGAIGQIVKNAQLALTAAGFDTHGADGWFGQATVQAMKTFQQSKSLDLSGVIDDGTWPLLMNAPVPSVSDRCLQLTAAFEGHGFGLAVGNFDGALLTWGIIGFTMAAGEVQSIILAVNATAPEKVQQAFGQSSEELLKIMQASKSEQTAWANDHTGSNGSLVEPWRTMFANFGEYPEVQAEQVKRVCTDYLSPAINTAKQLGMSSELALALCFDIHVQNGGIKPAVMKTIAQAGGGTEADLRVTIANAVADSANAKWREDVRRRKLTIATGSGAVHGHNYVLENWGLSSQYTAAELSSAAAAADDNR